MELSSLKNILNQKKQEIQKQGLQFKKNDLEKEREQQYIADQQQHQQKLEQQKQKYLEDLDKNYENPYKKFKKEEGIKDILNLEKKDNELPPIQLDEIVKKLRAFGVPITFFGETPMQRYKRLRKIEVEAEENKNEGGNVFDKFLKMNDDDFKNKQKQDEQFMDDDKINELFKSLKEGDNFFKQDQRTDILGFGQKKKQTNEKIKKVTNQKKHQDVYIWSKQTIKDWEQKLDQKFQSDESKKSSQGQKLIGTFRQTIEYLKPVFKLLKEQTCPQEILDGLYVIAHYCLMREYSKANDKYLELAIGNAAWPMGVTMVGIHERAGRSKIFSSQVAHILNDETTRKYLQSMKRLVTVSQMLNPSNDKSKMVNFDTLMEELF